VRIETADGRFLAWGAYSPTSMIRVRAWSFDEAERIDRAFFQRRIQRALALRQRLPIASDGVRLVHGEADGLPGLIVDRYGDTLSAQFLSAGTERWRDTLAELLLADSGCTACTSAAIPACARWKGWSRAAAGCAATATPPSPSRTRLAADAGRGPGPQDRLLPGPARQPRALCRLGAPLRPAAGAELLLLHRRLQRGRAGRRCHRRDQRRFIGARAGTRAGRMWR
jgi:hypothetical protein